EKLHYLNAAPINAIADRWIRQYSRERVRALADLKTALEAPMTETAADFVYTTFVYATPEQVWRGLTDPNFTRRYWGVELRSDWKIGSPVAWIERGVTLEDPEQVVLESDPYRRLAYVFPAFTRKYTDVSGFDDETAAKVVSEGSSHVAFDIEGLDDKVKLTVVHGGLAPGGAVQHLISGGWPVVLTNLKTFLEVDAVLPENLSTAH
ncbi:MAG: ArsR family transcriptional regulator, partial [Actinomycetia bacterium]|nr:ArsR family transcriptional regulator [Actinomycetes bacterium]